MRAWITWETQRRNEELANAFACEFFKFDYSALPQVVRYLKSISATWQVLNKRQYDLIFAQYPSLLLNLALIVCKSWFKYQLVIDAHNTAIRHLQSGGLLKLLASYALRHADMVIVSNQQIAQTLSTYRINATVLPDKIPHIPQRQLGRDWVHLPRPFVVLIATFAPDEPIDTFIKGVQLATQPITLFVTGQCSKAKNLLHHASTQIIFTDYLTYPQYEGLIQNADLLVDLTTLDNCLVCGAYEALAVGVPALVSDNAATREMFKKGFIFAKNSPLDYAQAIGKFFENRNLLKKEITDYRHEFTSLWSLNKEQIERLLLPQTSSPR